jgi:phosphoglycolate phosphatase
MDICLFDIDGTLLSSGGAGKAALETALAEDFGVAVTVKVPYSGRTDRAIARDLFRFHGIDDKPAHWQKLLAGYLRRLPECLARHNGQVLPGIARLLEHFAADGRVTLGLLTGNVRQGAQAKLGHYGLFHHFAFGGFGDHHFERNDVACEALEAAKKYVRRPLDPDRTWVVGDTPLDVSCARAIGVKVAAVATGWHSLQELEAAQPDLLLTDLSDPEPLLALCR